MFASFTHDLNDSSIAHAQKAEEILCVQANQYRTSYTHFQAPAK